jgi:hypothetical protein
MTAVTEPTPLPRSLDGLDRLLGADPPERDPGLLACFEPRFPDPPPANAQLVRALRLRADDRQREWLGPVGAELRRLDALGVLWLDSVTGVVRDRITGMALDRARFVLVVNRR